MNRNIRKLGVVFIALFVMLVAQLNYLQVIRSNQLANHPGNTRAAVRDFGEPRGTITTSDGLLIAESYRNPDKSSPYQYLRRYPRGPLYAHVTGYFSYNYGTSGIERSYANVLAGRKVAVTAKGLKALLSSKIVTGNVELTLNHKLQRVAAQSLRKRRGSVVALDPRTGAILASVSYPTYDPNPLASPNFKSVQTVWDALTKDPGRPMLARAYRERYAPGSTFKVVTAAAGLETEVVGMTTPVYPKLRSLPLRYTTRPLRNFGGSTCGGDLLAVFKVSCNTAFAQLGLDLGPEKLREGALFFGFNRNVSLDVAPSAVQSFFPPVEFFKRNDPQLAQSAIGQGSVSATTLQMAMVAGAIANKGVIMEPHFMREVRSNEGELISSETTNKFITAVSEETAANITTMMKAVVDKGGTGRRAAVTGVEVAAKTGTAQTGRGTAHAWTIAFAPANNPTIAVAVLVENQPEVSTLTGGKIAAPIARRVITSALSIQGEPDSAPDTQP
jgi:penicillin-binding protein A